VQNLINKDYLLKIIELLRAQYKGTNDPIPTYTEKEIDQLFNCINRAYLGYTINTHEILASIFYNIIKNHYLSNGNKRIAVTVTIIILIEYKKFLTLNQTIHLKNIAIQTASGNLNKQDVITTFNDFFLI